MSAVLPKERRPNLIQLIDWLSRLFARQYRGIVEIHFGPNGIERVKKSDWPQIDDLDSER